ncbi:MAG: RHS repeat-associated core domain-containing protein [Porticoccaceae bacterium]
MPPDNPYADALWIGEISQITRIRLDGQQPPLILAGAARALAVDSTGSIWVYGEGLRAYDFTGALLGAATTVPHNTPNARLAVNPHSGDAWLALGHRLHRYDADLTRLASWDLPDAAVQLAFAATTGRLWVATRSGVSVRDAAGSELFGLPPTGSGKIRALALDAQGFAWVSDGQNLRRYSPQGDLELSLALPGVDQVAPAADRLWLLSDRRVLLLDAATGAEHLALEPFTGGSGPDLLIANPVDGSAFVARDKSLLQIAADGAIAPVAEQPEKIRALALYADLTPPSLRFVAPAPGTLTNDERPALALTFADAATGVDPATLEITADGVPLPVACDFTADTADCLPQASLGDGGHELSATIADHAGNRSAPALTQVEVDTQAPVIDLQAPLDGLTTSEPEVAFRGSLSEPAALRLNGAAVAVDADGRFDHGPVALIPGANVFSLTATDAAGNRTTLRVTVTQVLNRAPVLAPIADQTASLGATLSFQVAAADPDGDPLSYCIRELPLPEGAEFDAATGEFRFRPVAEQAGILVLTFCVSDGELLAEQQIRIDIPAPDPAAPTGFTGRVLDANDAMAGRTTPIVNARISFLDTGQEVLTDADGYFTLTDLPHGNQVLDIDPGGADPGPGGAIYAGFREGFPLEAHVLNVVERPFYLPRLDAATLTTVDPVLTTTVHSAALGITLTVAPHTAKNADGSDFTGQLSISPVPENLAPAALPDFLDPAQLITIQPVGVTFSTPAPISFPNLDGMAPGNEMEIWSLDPELGAFVVVGTGVVSADGRSVVTISGGVRAADWHAALPPGASASEQGDAPNCGCGASEETGSSVNLRTGWTTTEIRLPAHRALSEARAPRFVYRSERALPRPMVLIDGTVPRRAAVPSLLSYRASVGGVDQGSDTYLDTDGFSESLDEPFRISVPLDADHLPSGIYPYTVTLTSLYSLSRRSSSVNGSAVVVNERDSAFGAGWGLAELSRLHRNRDGSVLIASGSGAQQVYRPMPTDLRDWTAINYNTRWAVNAAGDQVTQTDNGEPGFFFGPDDLINTTLRGKFRVNTTSDDDYIGLVMGYRGPLVHSDNPLTAGPLTTLLFDWKQLNQNTASEGFNLVRITDGSIYRLGDSFWAHGLVPVPGVFDVLATDYGTTKGWLDQTDHFFDVDYFSDRVTIRIDGVTIFDVAGSFAPGRFGFYNFSQANVSYQLFSEVGSYETLDGDFARLVGLADGRFLRTLNDGTRQEYDAAGLLTAEVDRNGNTTAYAYDAEGKLLRITDPAGALTVFTYSGGRLSSVTDPAGRVSQFDHDADGNLIRVVFPDGAARDFGYDGHHLMTSERDARGALTQRTYDATGRLLHTLRADGTTRAATNAHAAAWVDPADGLGTATDPAPVVRPEAAVSTFTDGNGATSSYVTDAFGHTLELVDANGLTTRTERDADGNPVRTIRPDGSSITRTYDARGNLLTETQQFNGATRRWTHDPVFSLPTAMTDPLGHATTYTRDANGNLVRMRNALGQETRFTYDGRGLVTSVIDPNGLTTVFTYDARGLPELVTETPPAGGGALRETRYSYDAAGQPTRIALPEGVVLDLAYDLRGRLTGVTDNLGNREEYRYDAEGNRIETLTRDPDGSLARRQAQAFDPLGRRSALIEPGESADAITAFGYDGAGNPVAITDPNGRVTQHHYDPGRRLIGRTDALGGATAFAHDALGQVVEVAAPNGAVTAFTHDSLGRPLTESSPDRGDLVYTHDAADRLLTRTDARGITATYSYDALDRLVAVRYPDPGEDVTLTYDDCPFGIGRLCAREDASGHYAFAYDAYGNLTRQEYTTEGVPYVTTYAYDAAHRLVALGYPGGREVQFAYDAVGRLSEVATTIGGSPKVLASAVTWRADGRLSGRSFGNGLRETRSYDARGQLLSQQLGADTTTYHYDPVGNLLARRLPGAEHGWDYDALDRVIRDRLDARERTYAYDANHNRLDALIEGIPEAYGYAPASNRLTAIATPATSRVLSRDATGNLTDDGAGQTFTYNQAGRLASAGTAAGITTYRYNALGLRTHKEGMTDVVFHYDAGGRLLAETTPDGTPIRSYVWFGDAPLAQLDGPLDAETPTYLHTDHLATPRLGTDASGIPVWRWESPAFGDAPPSLQLRTVNLRFPGQYFDHETGLHQNWHRDYDPSIGRYAQSDPIGLDGGVNLYGYALQNPIRFTDPFGLRCWTNEFGQNVCDSGSPYPSGYCPSGDCAAFPASANNHKDSECMEKCRTENVWIEVMCDVAGGKAGAAAATKLGPPVGIAVDVAVSQSCEVLTAMLVCKCDEEDESCSVQ